MKKKIDYIISLTATCIILGVILGIQFKHINNQMLDAASYNTENRNVSDITSELEYIKEKNEALIIKLKEAEKKLAKYESLGDYEDDLSEIEKELEKCRIAAGQVSLQGRGVSVTMTDGSSSAGASVDVNAYLIHDEDILLLINELSAAGAEAISVNGQRIVSNTAIRCVGPVVSINDSKVAAPFVITAIGEPDVLESALKMRGGFIDALAPWGIEVSIKKSEYLEVPAFEQDLVLKEAKPVENDSKELEEAFNS